MLKNLGWKIIQVLEEGISASDIDVVKEDIRVGCEIEVVGFISCVEFNQLQYDIKERGDLIDKVVEAFKMFKDNPPGLIVMGDGSIRGKPGDSGTEFVLPVMGYEEAIKKIPKLCKILTSIEYPYSSNETCGYHLTFSSEDKDIKQKLRDDYLYYKELGYSSFTSFLLTTKRDAFGLYKLGDPERMKGSFAPEIISNVSFSKEYFTNDINKKSIVSLDDITKKDIVRSMHISQFFEGEKYLSTRMHDNWIEIRSLGGEKGFELLKTEEGVRKAYNIGISQLFRKAKPPNKKELYSLMNTFVKEFIKQNDSAYDIKIGTKSEIVDRELYLDVIGFKEKLKDDVTLLSTENLLPKSIIDFAIKKFGFEKVLLNLNGNISKEGLYYLLTKNPHQVIKEYLSRYLTSHTYETPTELDDIIRIVLEDKESIKLTVEYAPLFFKRISFTDFTDEVFIELINQRKEYLFDHLSWIPETVLLRLIEVKSLRLCKFAHRLTYEMLVQLCEEFSDFYLQHSVLNIISVTHLFKLCRSYPFILLKAFWNGGSDDELPKSLYKIFMDLLHSGKDKKIFPLLIDQALERKPFWYALRILRETINPGVVAENYPEACRTLLMGMKRDMIGEWVYSIIDTLVLDQELINHIMAGKEGVFIYQRLFNYTMKGNEYAKSHKSEIPILIKHLMLRPEEVFEHIKSFKHMPTILLEYLKKNTEGIGDKLFLENFKIITWSLYRPSKEILSEAYHGSPSEFVRFFGQFGIQTLSTFDMKTLTSIYEVYKENFDRIYGYIKSTEYKKEASSLPDIFWYFIYKDKSFQDLLVKKYEHLLPIMKAKFDQLGIE